MKTLIYTCIIILCLPLHIWSNSTTNIPNKSNSTNTTCPIVTNGLIAYYPFNGNADDESGNGYHGTINGASLTTDRNGNVDSAYDFNGINNKITVNNPFGNSFTDESPYSLAFWFKTSTTKAEVNLLTYFTKCGGGFEDDYFAISIKNGNTIVISNGNGSPFQINNAQLNNNESHFMALSHSGTNYDLYLDGALLASFSIPSSTFTIPDTYDLVFGYVHTNNCGDNSYFDGVLDDIRIYDRTLSSQEVLSIYLESPFPISADNLVAYYPFDGNADDESGNGNHAIVNGAVLTNDRFGNLNSAYHFNGTSQYILLENNNDNFNVQNHTISAWIKWENGAVCCGGGGIFDVVSSDLVIDHFSLTAHGTYVRQWINYPASPNSEFRFDTDILSGGQFHHLVTSYDGSKRQLWLDGNLLDENFFSESISYSSNTKAYIGVNFPGGNDYFKGTIDEVEVYSKALSEAEILSLYNQTLKIQHYHRLTQNGKFSTESLLQNYSIPSQPNDKFKVCADGAQASIFKITSPSCFDLNNLIFRVKEDPDGVHPNLFGSFGNLIISNNELSVEYTHPTFFGVTSGKTVSYSLEIYNTLTNNVIEEIELVVYRAPVLMIHGLWGAPSSFEEMEQEFQDADLYYPLFTLRANYEETHGKHFEENKRVVPNHIDELFTYIVRLNQVAVGKADIVAHSMGGVLSRYYIQDYGFRGDINKFITLNTPHAGSQYANLLKDPNAQTALDNIICTFNDCNGGALDDLKVDSDAILNVLNSLTPNVNIPIHSIVTHATPDDIEGNINTAILIAKKLDWLNPNVDGVTVDDYIDELFNNEKHDLIVADESQKGGLTASNITIFNNQQHTGVAKKSEIIDKVKDLLALPVTHSSFSQSPFAPPILEYTLPTVLSFSQPSVAAKSLMNVQITAPASGTIITKGDTLSITISGNQVFDAITAIVDEPGEISFVGQQDNLDTATFLLLTDSVTLGKKTLMAVGYDSLSNSIELDTLQFFVFPDTSIDSIMVYPSSISISKNEFKNISITGHFQGYESDISDLPGLHFLFSENNASNEGTNLIHGDRLGKDTLIVGWGGKFSIPIPIEISTPIACSYPPTVTLVSDTLRFEQSIYAGNTIISESIIYDDADITFKAGESFELEPGFEIDLGSTFITIFENCVDTLRFDSCLIVTNTNDSGMGSLRNAMECAQAGDLIEFQIIGTSPFMIQPQTPLPILDQNNLTIDARTQPEFQAGDIIIDGAMMTGDGIVFEGMNGRNGLKLYGLDIQNFENGLEIRNTNNFTIRYNQLSNNSQDAILIVNSEDGILMNNLIFENFGGVALDTLPGNAAPANNISLRNNSLFCNSDTTITLTYAINDIPTIDSANVDTIFGTSTLPYQVIQVFESETGSCIGSMIPCQGKTLLGMTISDKNGNWELDGIFTLGMSVTATSTNLEGGTSSFANCKIVMSP